MGKGKSIADKHLRFSGTDMTGRPGDRTVETNRGSTASYLTRTLASRCFMFILLDMETKELLDFHG